MRTIFSFWDVAFIGFNIFVGAHNLADLNGYWWSIAHFSTVAFYVAVCFALNPKRDD